METPVEIQKKYYTETATNYDALHTSDTTDSEHVFALQFLSTIINLYQIKSVLDIGAGTGRTIVYLKEKHAGLKVIGIEPIEELRKQGYAKGIDKNELIEGDGNCLTFKNGEFDLVCEFAVLHHVAKPDAMVKEMLRVAGKCIFISDSNNFGQGSKLTRLVKQLINSLGLWKAYNYIRTGGKVYQISKNDGLFYSYSVFNNYKQIKEQCKSVHALNITGKGINPYRNAAHVALWGIKK